MPQPVEIPLRRASGQGYGSAAGSSMLGGAANAIAQATQRLGGVFEKMANIEASHRLELQEQQKVAAANDMKLNFAKAMHEQVELQKGEENLRPGADGFSNDFSEFSENWVRTELGDYRKKHGEQAAEALEDQLGKLAWEGYLDAHTFEKQERRAYRVNNTMDTIEGIAQMAIDDPVGLETYFEQGLAAIEDQGLDPESKRKLEGVFGRLVAEGIVEKFLRTDPRGIEDIFEKEIIRGSLSPEQIERYRGRAEDEIKAEEREARIEADRAERKAQAARSARIGILDDRADDAITVYDKGANPAGLDDLKSDLRKATDEMAGTPEGKQAAYLLDRITRAGEASEDARRFGIMRPTEQAQVIDHLEQGDQTPESLERIERFEAIQKENEEAFRNGRALERAQDLGMIDQVSPLDMENLNADELANRMAQAWAVGEIFDRVDILPFTEAEFEQLEQRFDQMEPDAALAEIAKIGQALPDGQYNAVLDRIDNDRPLLGFAADMLADAPANKSTALEILHGERKISQEGYKAPSATDLGPVVDNHIAAAFESDPSLKRRAIDAATALYVERQSQAGVSNGDFDQAAFERALDDVIGGQPVEWNGTKVVPPKPGLGPDDLQYRLENLPEDLPLMFDQRGEQIDFSILGQRKSFVNTTDYAELVSKGPGRYWVRVGGAGFALNEDGDPYVLDLTKEPPARSNNRSAALEARQSARHGSNPAPLNAEEGLVTPKPEPDTNAKQRQQARHGGG